MKITSRVILINSVFTLSLMSFSQTNGGGNELNKRHYPEVENLSFDTGEYLEYKVSYGWFSIGEAYAHVKESTIPRQGRECYEFDMRGKTGGFFKALSKVNDYWSSQVDKESMLPLYSYRNIREGGHTKEDKVKYDQLDNQLEYSRLNKKTWEYNPFKTYETEGMIFDLPSTILYLRTIDYSNMSKGDTIPVNAFYNKKFYDFKIIYLGKDRVKTKLGKINCIKLKPEMPKNKIFSGKNSLRFWLSDDENKIPVKFEVDMFIGDAGLEIVKASGLKHDTDYYRK
ncbi:MAG: DUF3108 domain-containing protein [Bacteroidota bacterium]